MNEITKRFVLHVGYSCNIRCRFCYYHGSLKNGTVSDLTTEEIKKRLRIARRYGMRAVDFSGGEPTIRKDLPEIIRYTKEIGFETICVISNGLRMSNREYCKTLISSGLNDALLSLHSAHEDSHDYLTQVNGSWQKLRQAMLNLKDLNQTFRINTVINNKNYNDLDVYFNYIAPFEPRAVNLLVFNPAEECMTDQDEAVRIADYPRIGQALTLALDKHSGSFNRINVRFFPFCLLKGHEDKIRTMWQKIYEKEEWDPVLFMKFRKNNFYLMAAFLLGLAHSISKLPWSGAEKTIYTRICELVQNGRIFYNYVQPAACKTCSMQKICPGLPRGYVKNVSTISVAPYLGKPLTDPLTYCRKYQDSFKSDA